MNQDEVMISTIRDLFYFLSQPDLTLDDVNARVGPVAHDPGGLMPMELRSTLPQVRASTLARYPNSDSPYMLDLIPTPEARPTAAMLRSFLGDYHRAATDMGRPWKLLFHPPADEGSCRVAVIADLEAGASDLNNAPIIHVAFRRDLEATDCDQPKQHAS